MYSVSAPFLSCDVTRDGNGFSYRPSYNEHAEVWAKERGDWRKQPQVSGRHVRIDSLPEHWQSDICCAEWQSTITATTNTAGNTADDDSCGTQSLYFPVITKPRQRTNQWTMSQTGKIIDCQCLNMERRSERQFRPHSKHIYTQTSNLWKQQRYAIFWDITQRRVVMPYQRFGAT